MAEQDHWPYARCNEIGPGPRGKRKRRRDKWDCSCHQSDTNNDIQLCECKEIGGTRTKRFKNNLRKKRAYGKQYRAFVKARKIRTGSKHKCNVPRRRKR